MFDCEFLMSSVRCFAVSLSAVVGIDAIAPFSCARLSGAVDPDAALVVRGGAAAFGVIRRRVMDWVLRVLRCVLDVYYSVSTMLAPPVRRLPQR